MSAFATLQRLARRPPPGERCNLCGAAVASTHQHLIDPVTRTLACACDPCAVLFYGSGETKFKRVPRRIRRLPEFHLTDGQWDSLMIPIGLAFFVASSLEKRVLALYPSPAGSTESLLSLDAWKDIVNDNPVLERMESDVEALLVNRLNQSAEYYIAPIDKCYELVGVIRSNWRGLSGGTEVWEEIRVFFEKLKDASNA